MTGTRPLEVLKFGSSVLRDEAGLEIAVEEIYRRLRLGRLVVAVVSALRGRTDELFAEAGGSSRSADPEAVAAHVARGELECVSMLGLALDRAGIEAALADSGRIGLRAEGPLLDAAPAAVDVAAVTALLARKDVLVVPGFLGRDGAGATALFGRGGSDLSALFLAHRLGASRCVLLKDTEGVFEYDPNAAVAMPPRRYAGLGFHDALAIDGRVLQKKALHFAAIDRIRFEVTAPGCDRGTLVGDETRLAAAEVALRPVRVALFGHGQVGAELARRLRRRPDLWTLVGVAVRRPARHPELPPELVYDDVAALAREPADAVVELIGGLGTAAAVIEDAIERGRPIVTANKELMAARGEELLQEARMHGLELRFGAAVGGSLPLLERIALLARDGRFRAVEGILNGTANFVLDRLATGESLDAALAAARAAGLCEADADDDLSGRDALRKLVLVARAAFGRDPDEVELGPPIDRSPDAGPRRQIASLIEIDGRLKARVRLVATAKLEQPFRDCRAERNVVRLALRAGEDVWLSGRGAGPAPTAEAVLADLHDIRRALRPRLAPPARGRTGA